MTRRRLMLLTGTVLSTVALLLLLFNIVAINSSAEQQRVLTAVHLRYLVAQARNTLLRGDSGAVAHLASTLSTHTDIEYFALHDANGNRLLTIGEV